MQNYAFKPSTSQKKDVPSASSIIDASSQSVSLQQKADMANNAAQRAETPRPNNTGMPDNLKSGIESLSGFSMDDVRVHYNSSKPATVQALAYTQGTDIHVAPGQEKHLPHEAWHVAQQTAGRVSPTTNINGMPVNDNAGLEHEADVMGEKAVGQRKETRELPKGHVIHKICQRTTEINYEPQCINYCNSDMNKVDTVTIGKKSTAKLDPNDPVQGTEPGSDQDDFMKAIIPNGYKKNPFVKGHLLNHNVGGLGIAENMVPLTKNANALHEMFVEQAVKNFLFHDYEVEYTIEAKVFTQNSSTKHLSKTNQPVTYLRCQIDAKKPSSKTNDFTGITIIESGPEPEWATINNNLTYMTNEQLKKDHVFDHLKVSTKDLHGKIVSGYSWGGLTDKKGYSYSKEADRAKDKTTIGATKTPITFYHRLKNKPSSPIMAPLTAVPKKRARPESMVQDEDYQKYFDEGMEKGFEHAKEVLQIMGIKEIELKTFENLFRTRQP